jgi:hypothetical protein
MPLTALRLTNESGQKELIIDQDFEGADYTLFDTDLSKFLFNQDIEASNFIIDGGAQLSMLNGFAGISDVKDWIDNYVKNSINSTSGANTIIVSPNSPLDNSYDTIQEAINNCVDGGTIYIVNGTYSGTNTLNPNKSVNIVGETKNGVILTSDLNTNVFVQTSTTCTKNYSFENITFQTTKNAILLESSNKVEISNIKFENCGWNGTVALGEYQNLYASLWSSVNTSDGAAIHIKKNTDINIDNVEIIKCVKGVVIEDSNSGNLKNILVKESLHHGIHLDSSTNDATNGCSNFNISNCSIKCAHSNGIRITGGKQISIIGCIVDHSFNAGIQFINSVECDLVGCTLTRNNKKSFNGLGENGDSQGTLSVIGEAGVTVTTYVLNVSGCTFSCGEKGSELFAYALFAADINNTVNISGCGYICFDPIYRANDLTIVTDSQLSWITSQLHSLH